MKPGLAQLVDGSHPCVNSHLHNQLRNFRRTLLNRNGTCTSNPMGGTLKINGTKFKNVYNTVCVEFLCSLRYTNFYSPRAILYIFMNFIRKRCNKKHMDRTYGWSHHISLYPLNLFETGQQSRYLIDIYTSTRLHAQVDIDASNHTRLYCSDVRCA